MDGKNEMNLLHLYNDESTILPLILSSNLRHVDGEGVLLNAPSNVLLNTCSMVVVDTADNFACLPKEKFQYVVNERATGTGNEICTMEFVNILNTGTHLQ